MPPKFVLCPRCELNYMPNEPGRKYCDVCLAALKLIDPSNMLPDDDMESVLCPRCKQNYISPDEEMCEACREAEKKGRKDIEPDWNDLVDVDPDDVYDDDPVEISFDELAEEEEERGRDEFAPEDEENPDYDDFDSDYDDEDFDEDFDEDEDDEDFEDDEE